MKKLLALFALVVMVLLIASSCTVNINSGGATVSGTLHFANMSASNVSVAVQQGSSVYGTSVGLSGIANQSGSYAISNVAFGTYTVYVTFDSPYTTYNSAYYYIDGFGPSTFVPSRGGAVWTETIVAVSVQADTSVDTYLLF